MSSYCAPLVCMAPHWTLPEAHQSRASDHSASKGPPCCPRGVAAIAAAAACRRWHPSHSASRPPQATTGEAFVIALAIYAAVCLGILLAFTW